MHPVGQPPYRPERRHLAIGPRQISVGEPPAPSDSPCFVPAGRLRDRRMVPVSLGYAPRGRPMPPRDAPPGRPIPLKIGFDAPGPPVPPPGRNEAGAIRWCGSGFRARVVEGSMCAGIVFGDGAIVVRLRSEGGWRGCVATPMVGRAHCGCLIGMKGERGAGIIGYRFSWFGAGGARGLLDWRYWLVPGALHAASGMTTCKALGEH